MKYIETMITRYNASYAIECTSPCSTTIDLDAQAMEDKTLDEIGKKRCQSSVGAPMYAATGSCPDVAYGVAKLCKYSTKPLVMHWTVAIIRSLNF